jgi:beta-galactosidase
VYIASRGWTRRIATDTPPEPVDVYSNLSSVTLSVNGKAMNAATPNEVKRASWNVAFRPGDNVLIASGKSGTTTIADTLHISFRYQPLHLADKSVPFRELGVNAGSKAQVADSVALWTSDREYSTGTFGHVGGAPTMFDKDLPITHTGEVPLYFTYLKGLSAYRFDVPDGQYDVDLLFAEPDAKPGERVFSISANGKSVAQHLDLSVKCGIAHATVITTRVRATGGKGIHVSFTPEKGVPILNAIHVRKK